MHPSADSAGESLGPSACTPVVGLTLMRSVMSGPAHAEAAAKKARAAAQSVARFRIVDSPRYENDPEHRTDFDNEIRHAIVLRVRLHVCVFPPRTVRFAYWNRVAGHYWPIPLRAVHASFTVKPRL